MWIDIIYVKNLAYWLQPSLMTFFKLYPAAQQMNVKILLDQAGFSLNPFLAIVPILYLLKTP